MLEKYALGCFLADIVRCTIYWDFIEKKNKWQEKNKIPDFNHVNHTDRWWYSSAEKIQNGKQDDEKCNWYN